MVQNLESMIAEVILDPSVRDSCGIYLKNWMFLKKVYQYLVETLLTPQMMGRTVNKKIIHLYMQANYPDLMSQDWITIESLIDGFVPISDQDLPSVINIVSTFIKDRLHQKGIDLYVKGMRVEAEPYLVEATTFKIVQNPFVNPNEEGLLDKLRDRDMPLGGKVIKSSLGLVNSVAQYGGYKNGDLIMVTLKAKAGKCVRRNTPIIMYDGKIKKVQDISSGEYLLGPDSKPRQVLATGSGREMMYRITPNKGDSYVVNESHILSLKNTITKEIINISVKDYLRKDKSFRRNNKGWRPSGVDFAPHPENLGILSSYFLGLWLAEGTHNLPSITNPDREVIDYVYTYAYSLGMAVRETKRDNDKDCVTLHLNCGTVGRGSVNILLNELRRFNLISNKHIPYRYKTGSRQERLDLLAGLIDGDGCYLCKDNDSQSFEVIFKDEILMDDLIFVARSLGFVAYKRKKIVPDTNNFGGGTYYRCHISGDLETIPTKIRRKMVSPRKTSFKRGLLTAITVEPLGVDTYYGFELDGDGLFLLGDFQVTHNTQYMIQESAAAAHQGFNVAHMFFGDYSEFDGICRLLSCITGTPISEVMKNYNALKRECERYLDHIRIAAFPALSLDTYEVIAHLKKLRKQFGFSFCVLDYDSNIRSPKDESMYTSGGLMYGAFKGFASETSTAVMIGCQTKPEYWNMEVLPETAPNESSRKQHHVDFMICGGRNQKTRKVGTFNLPLVRRGVSGEMTRVRFDDLHSRIEDITPQEYERTILENFNRDTGPSGDTILEGVRFDDREM
jgi:Hom_end-associated Hint/Homing endonuclease